MASAKVLYDQLLNLVDKPKLQARYLIEVDRPFPGVDVVFDHYIKFIVLKMLEKDFEAAKLSPGNIIDEMWHLHILDTVDYAKMCGNTFIHHEPLPQSGEQRLERLTNTALAFRAHFNEEPHRGMFHLLSDVIDVNVIDNIGYSHNFTVDKTSTVRDLKLMIRKKLGIAIERQRLIGGSAELKDDEVLCDVEGILEQKVVFLGWKRQEEEEVAPTNLPGTMEIYFKTLANVLTNAHGTLRATPLDNIQKIKLLIKDACGVPSEQQRLVYNKSVLENRKTLADYDIQEKATIYVINNLGGC